MTVSNGQTRRAGSPLSAYGIAALLLGSGVGHFVTPALFDAALPAELPGEARAYTYVSGLVEVAIGALLLVPRTRRIGGRAALTFFVIITPVIVNGVRLARGRGRGTMLVALARLPLQILILDRAWRIGRHA